MTTQRGSENKQTYGSVVKPKVTTNAMTENNGNIPYLSFDSKHEVITTPDDVVEPILLNNDAAVHMRHSFVHKLYFMLNDLEAKGYDYIISWIGDGKGFKIHNPTLFEASIQPKYFRQSRGILYSTGKPGILCL